MGSEYGNIPFADDIKALIDLLDEKIVSLTDAIATLTANLEGYDFDFLFRQWRFKPSDNLRASNDTENSTKSTSYVKLLSLTFDPLPDWSVTTSHLRLKFSLKAGNPFQWSYGKIYRNGVAVGSEVYEDDGNWQLFSVDIDGWNVGDTIELWVRTSNDAVSAYCKNLRGYGDAEMVEYIEPTW